MLDKGKNEWVRRAAALSLAEIGFPARSALPLLKEGLDDPDINIRKVFQTAIEKLDKATESPAEARKARGSKALVERAIIRLVTPGTLTEETLLESGAANWLAAIGRAGDDWAIAAADISTGRFELVACGPGELAAELARLSPAETIADAPVPGVRTSAGKGGFDPIRSQPVGPHRAAQLCRWRKALHRRPARFEGRR